DLISVLGSVFKSLPWRRPFHTWACMFKRTFFRARNLVSSTRQLFLPNDPNGWAPPLNVMHLAHSNMQFILEDITCLSPHRSTLSPYPLIHDANHVHHPPSVRFVVRYSMGWGGKKTQAICFPPLLLPSPIAFLSRRVQ